MTELAVGAILAGGLARRFGGGDKSLLMVGDQSVLSRLITRLEPQVARLILNANEDADRFTPFGLPVVPDDVPGHPGPLAGVLAALQWAKAETPSIHLVLTVPADTPFLPRDLLFRLCGARVRESAILAYASSGGRTHPIIAIWPTEIEPVLRRAVTEEGTKKVGEFMGRFPCVKVDWEADPIDPFFNVNTPADLVEARRLATLGPGL
jgi:molybdopterin-guanine dinucleotide biosynthesis protein A